MNGLGLTCKVKPFFNYELDASNSYISFPSPLRPVKYIISLTSYFVNTHLKIFLCRRKIDFFPLWNQGKKFF